MGDQSNIDAGFCKSGDGSGAVAERFAKRDSMMVSMARSVCAKQVGPWRVRRDEKETGSVMMCPGSAGVS